MFSRNLILIFAGLFACVTLWTIGLLSGIDVFPQKAEFRKKIPGGRLETTAEVFTQSPYVVDTVLSDDVDFLFYKHPEGKLTGPAKHTWRIYSPGKSSIAIQFSFFDALLENRPRVWLYDEKGQLIQSGEFEYNKNEKKGIFQLTVPSSGMYKVKLMFSYGDVVEIQNSGKNHVAELTYVNYIRENSKVIDLTIPGLEFDKLADLMLKAKDIWSEEKPVNVQWPRYIGVKGRVFGELKTKKGENARVAIGLSGRSMPHLPRGNSPLPSLDVKVLTGPLPYGLRHFKLYALHSKGTNEIIHTSILEDYGLVSPRLDRVEVILNGRSVGQMHLLESIDDHFFEAAQKIEGPVFGYDPDATSGYFFDNKFSVKNFAKNRTYTEENYPDIASNEFSKKINTFQLLLAQSYGFTYAAYHGLGQGDLRYHWNIRTETYDSIVKDLDAGVLAPNPRDFLNSWVYLNPFAPLWRPNAVTIASYYIDYTASSKKRYQVDGTYQGLFLWHTPPSTLNILQDIENRKTIGVLNHMWAASWNRQMVHNRISNLYFALTEKRIDLKPLSITQDLMPKKLWSPFVNGYPENVSRTGRLINELTDGHITPNHESLLALHWRNAVIKEITEQSQDVPHLDTKTSPQSQVLTFLYRNEDPEFSHFILVERNPKKEMPVKVALKNLAGDTFYPSRIKYYDGKMQQATNKEIDLSDIKENEAIRLYWFQISRKNSYQYFFPEITGSGTARTPREMVVLPGYEKRTQKVSNTLNSIFREKDDVLTLKNNNQVISGEWVIPKGKTFLVDSNSTLKFKQTGCFKVYGNLIIADNSHLTLTADDKKKGWSGVHFYGGDRTINNITIEAVGTGNEHVICGGSKFTGGVSFYNANVEISDLVIKNSHVEDALHILNSEVKINALFVDKAQSDCMDADYSVIKMTDSQFKNCNGDGVDVSGSLLFLSKSEFSQSGDKNISIGENSRGYLSDVSIIRANIGVAAKDGSVVHIKSSLIKKNNTGIAAYSKKPYFVFPGISISEDVIFSDNEKDKLIYRNVH